MTVSHVGGAMAMVVVTSVILSKLLDLTVLANPILVVLVAATAGILWFYSPLPNENRPGTGEGFWGFPQGGER